MAGPFKRASRGEKYHSINSLKYEQGRGHNTEHRVRLHLHLCDALQDFSEALLSKIMN